MISSYFLGLSVSELIALAKNFFLERKVTD